LLDMYASPIRSRSFAEENILDPEGIHRKYIEANLAELSISLSSSTPLGRMLRPIKDLNEVVG